MENIFPIICESFNEGSLIGTETQGKTKKESDCHDLLTNLYSHH